MFVKIMKLLFICTANMQRSPTAEEIFKDKYETKSAGVSSSARVVLTKAALNWADIVFVMEDWQRKTIADLFPNEYLKKRIIVLDIPDIYNYMDQKLIVLLKNKVPKYI
jgi:predicted protein tyrosine phosphatase